MAKKVLILDGKVQQVADEEFEVHSDWTWMDCSDDSVNRQWTLVDGILTPPDTSIKSSDWAKFRNSRDRKLQQTDWTQSRDVTLSNDTAWKTYRQALRDLPAVITDPRDPTWPTKPS